MVASQPKPDTQEIIAVLLQHERLRKIFDKLFCRLDEIINNDKIQLVVDCAGKHVSLKLTLRDE